MAPDTTEPGFPKGSSLIILLLSVLLCSSPRSSRSEEVRGYPVTQAPVSQLLIAQVDLGDEDDVDEDDEEDEGMDFVPPPSRYTPPYAIRRSLDVAGPHDPTARKQAGPRRTKASGHHHQTKKPARKAHTYRNRGVRHATWKSVGHHHRSRSSRSVSRSKRHPVHHHRTHTRHQGRSPRHVSVLSTQARTGYRHAAIPHRASDARRRHHTSHRTGVHHRRSHGSQWRAAGRHPTQTRMTRRVHAYKPSTLSGRRWHANARAASAQRWYRNGRGHRHARHR